MTIKATVIADSVNISGDRITTLLLRYPLVIHSELLTHRVFSRNSQSNRAMSVEKLIADVESDPYIPQFTVNKKGMASNDLIDRHAAYLAEAWWKETMHESIAGVKSLGLLNVHKQHANRLLMPFQHINTILTGTDFDNFFRLRISPDAQPEIRELAEKMRDAMACSEPTRTENHVPFSESGNYCVSVARCARVSYGNVSDVDSTEVSQDDIELHDRLKRNGHMSPFEHQARGDCGRFYNLHGWKSYRWMLENGEVA